MEPTYFPSAAAFRAWLEAHHATAAELLVGFHKKGTGLPSIDWPEARDEALCFGWIDGVRKSFGPARYDPVHAAAQGQHLEQGRSRALRRADRRREDDRSGARAREEN